MPSEGSGGDLTVDCLSKRLDFKVVPDSGPASTGKNGADRLNFSQSSTSSSSTDESTNLGSPFTNSDAFVSVDSSRDNSMLKDASIPFCLSPALDSPIAGIKSPGMFWRDLKNRDQGDEVSPRSSLPLPNPEAFENHEPVRSRRGGSSRLDRSHSVSSNPALVNGDSFSTPSHAGHDRPETPKTTVSSWLPSTLLPKRCPGTPERTPGWAALQSNNYLQMKSVSDELENPVYEYEDEEQQLYTTPGSGLVSTNKRRRRRARHARFQTTTMSDSSVAGAFSPGLSPIPRCALAEYLDSEEGTPSPKSDKKENCSDISRQSSLSETKLLVSLESNKSSPPGFDLTLGEGDHARGDETPLHEEDVSFASQFQVIGILGSGEFSQVLKVQSLGDPSNTFAVKKTKRQFRGRLDREHYLEEVYSYRKIRPPCVNIVRYYKAWQEDGHLYVQMELCSLGTLGKIGQHVESSGSKFCSEHVLWKILHDVLNGLVHLHANNIIHTDIKPDNLLVHDSGMVKIGDLGLARDMDNNFSGGEDGDVVYISMEFFQGSTRSLAPPTDMFSLGLSMLQVCSAIDSRIIPLPASGPRWRELRESKIPILEPCRSQSFTHIVQSMLAQHPSKRPTASSVFSHPLVSEGASFSTDLLELFHL